MPVTDAPLQHQRLNGVDFAWHEQGEGPLALCLHGFPDTARTFDGLLPALAQAGYRAVAPYLRGYYPSGLAPDHDYSMVTLGRDTLAFIAALGGGRPAVVIGHDWGGYAALSAAIQAPQAVHKLVVMSVPHMRHSAMDWVQLRKSWYVWLFQLPWLPERLLRRDGQAFIDRLYAAWSPGWDPAHWDLGPVKRALGMPGGSGAALAYYRGMVRGSSRAVRDLLAREVSVPALVIHGEADGSVDCGQFHGLERAYTAGVTGLGLPGVGHFPHREAPLAVQRAIIDFLGTNTQGVPHG